MSVFKYFKNIPRSPSHKATGPKYNVFFLQICNEVPGEKKGGPVAHPRGDRGLSPVGGATGSLPPILTPDHHSPPFPLSFEPKNSETKERGEEKKSGETLSNCVLLIYYRKVD